MSDYCKYHITYKHMKDVCNDLVEKATNKVRGLKELQRDPAFCTSIVLITTEDNRFIGRIAGIKQDNLTLILMAAENVDYKVRKLQSVKFTKRTYPIYFTVILKCEVVEIKNLPLYINFEFISHQFKSAFLK